MHCTENSEINDKMSGVDVIDLCSENQTKNNEFHKGKEITKQESQDKKKSKTITRMGSKNRPRKGKPMAESEDNEIVMMCWENLKDSLGKGPHEESDDGGKKLVKNMQKFKR